MFRLPSAAIVSNRCWSTIKNRMLGLDGRLLHLRRSHAEFAGRKRRRGRCHHLQCRSPVNLLHFGTPFLKYTLTSQNGVVTGSVARRSRKPRSNPARSGTRYLLAFRPFSPKPHLETRPTSRVPTAIPANRISVIAAPVLTLRIAAPYCPWLRWVTPTVPPATIGAKHIFLPFASSFRRSVSLVIAGPIFSVAATQRADTGVVTSTSAALLQ